MVIRLRLCSICLFLFCLYISGCSLGPDYTGKSETKVVYGFDKRKEIYSPDNDPLMVSLADSTVIIINKIDTELSTQNNSFKLLGVTIGDYENLCVEEPFRDELSVGNCSGFLVAPDLIATASHCMDTSHVTPDPCKDNVYVFGYSYNKNIGGVFNNPAEVNSRNVYFCRKILAIDRDIDYALIQLDRPVLDHKPLKMRRSGEVVVGDDLTIIGNPLGIPTKIAAGGKVREASDQFHFFGSLDSYHGNSGSAVFNSKSGLVEGILVAGEPDWVETEKGCLVTNICAEDGDCKGETVTETKAFMGLVPTF